jgi:hypothetical protein
MADNPYPTTGWLGEYLRYTDIQESPSGFHFWTGVVLIASALRRNVFLPWGSIPVFPNHYIILVAPQGRARKSTCISMGRQLVEQVPTIRVLAETSSPEAIVRDLQLQREDQEYRECSGLLVSSELAVFLGGQDYNRSLLKLITALYDCPSRHRDSKMRGNTALENVCLNWLGGTTQEWLSHAATEDDFRGGFSGRVLFIVRDDTDRERPEPEQPNVELRDALIASLNTYEDTMRAVGWTPEAKDWWYEWYTTHRRQLNDQQDNLWMRGYHERRDLHTLKLATILSVSEHGTAELTPDILIQADRILTHEEQFMPGAFRFVGLSEQGRVNEAVLENVTLGGGNNRQALYSNLRKRFNSFTIDEAMSTLHQGGLIQHCGEVTGARPPEKG